MKAYFFLMVAGLLVGFSIGPAQTIDFETVPGGAAQDKLLISTQYVGLYGVSFRYEDGSHPYLAKVGSPRTSFIGYLGDNDRPAPNQGIGSYFLTDKNINITNANQNLVPAALWVDYIKPVASASGVIIDLDDDVNPPNTGTEAWLFEAFNGSSNMIASVLINTTNSLAGNGLATPWNLKTAVPDIKAIRITFHGTKTNGIGFALDNFSPALPVAPPVLSIAATQGVNIVISGTIGSTNWIEYRTVLHAGQWQPLTNIVLQQTPQVFTDGNVTNGADRFYRVISIR